MPGALDDIRVIDFTHALNGPFCTMLLGHMGAEIIKIEPPGGDGFRRSWMPPNSKIDGYEFLWVNVNKKSVVLNLKTARGVDLAPGTPFAAMDALTPALRAAFGFIGVADPHFVDAQPLQFAREAERAAALSRAKRELIEVAERWADGRLPALARTG